MGQRELGGLVPQQGQVRLLNEPGKRGYHDVIVIIGGFFEVGLQLLEGFGRGRHHHLNLPAGENSALKRVREREVTKDKTHLPLHPV